MRVEDFIWLPDVIEKLIVKHAVTPEEVEQVFFDRPRYRFHETGHVEGEDLYTALGQTEAGRYLTVYFIFKSHNTALVISARDMDLAEVRRYARK